MNNLKKFAFISLFFLVFSNFAFSLERHLPRNYLDQTENSIFLTSEIQRMQDGGVNYHNAAYQSAIHLIRKAEKSIVVLNYHLTDQQLRTWLNYKAQEGLDITLVYAPEVAANITFISTLHPNIKLVPRVLNEGHMHHKLVVVDRKHSWLSSLSFISPNDPNLSLVVSDELLAETIHQEALSLEGLAERSNATPVEINKNDQILSFFLLPSDHKCGFDSIEKKMNKQAQEELFSLIKNAQNNITISMVVWTLKDVAKLLVEAKDRGVEIKIITANIDHQVLKILKDANIEVLKRPGLYHHKWMMVDNETLWHGSSNWSMNSFTRSDEFFCILHNLSQDQQELLQLTWQNMAATCQKL